MFKARSDSDKKLINKEGASALYHAVDQILFAMPRTSKYIQAAIKLLATRIKEIDKDYWWKLRQVLQ